MTRSDFEPNSFRMRTACFDSAFDRAQERRLLVERLAGPADEGGRDDEGGAVLREQQPGRAGRIPGGVTAGLERGTHAAGRETRGVGFALDQFLATELGDGAAVSGWRQERVVLFRGDAGERLEPVRVMSGAVLDRPVLHRGGNDVGRRGIERRALRNRLAQRLVDVAREPLPLHLVVECQGAEQFGGLGQHARRPGGSVHAPFDDALGGGLQR